MGQRAVAILSLWVVLGAGAGALGDAIPLGTSYLVYQSYGGTWVDAEKSPTNTEDDLMCWAAAAANILEWTGWGKTASMTTTDHMFDYFQDHWTDVGGLMEYAWDWWFDGTNNSSGWSGWSQVDVPGGGFYPSKKFGSYYHEQAGGSTALPSIDTFLRAGYGVTLAVYGPGGHAITCWGFNFDPNDPSRYYGLWITDSDDDKSQTAPPDRLRYYEVRKSGLRWYLEDFYGSDSWYIGEIQAMDRMNPMTPEPGVLALLGAGAVVLLRRR